MIDSTKTNTKYIKGILKSGSNKKSIKIARYKKNYIGF